MPSLFTVSLAIEKSLSIAAWRFTPGFRAVEFGAENGPAVRPQVG